MKSWNELTRKCTAHAGVRRLPHPWVCFLGKRNEEGKKKEEKIKSGCRDKCQGALTPPEELNGSLAATVTVLHITRIVSQVLLLQGAYSQGNGHFLLAKMLLHDPATTNKQTKKKAMTSRVKVREAGRWVLSCVFSMCDGKLTGRMRRDGDGTVICRDAPRFTVERPSAASCYVHFFPPHSKHMRNENQ